MPQGQVLAKQTAIDHNAMLVVGIVPARTGRSFRRVRIVMVVMMRMIVRVVVVIDCGDRVKMPRQVRVLTARPGMDYLTEKLHHHIGGNQSVTTETSHQTSNQFVE